MPNRLAGETSPYLLQHAHNPVDWYPWGLEALDRARAEDKPILLSIGYSACHWCHVMERESFQDPDIAALMNERFVCIKVDREERPDLDEIYMRAVQAFQDGHGGWPMTVFLTPTGEPYWGGTYFPPVRRGGMPGFPDVLRQMADLYQHNRGEIGRITGQVREYLDRSSRLAPGDGLREGWLDRVAAAAQESFDARNGGFGGAPKFPSHGALAALLAHWRVSAHPASLNMVTVTLDAMMKGALYDLLGGGFARYSVDAAWRVPHFEKMLYDNAQLVPVYVDAWRITGKAAYARIARETLDWLEREMSLPDGGFAASTDADSEGEEGRYFVWTPAELQDVLGEADGERVAELLQVTETGTFEHGTSVLRLEQPLEDLSDADRALLQASLPKLLARRQTRVAPDRDDKVITAWNALTLSAFARAGFAWGDDRLVERAARCGRFLRDHLVVDGRLMRTWKDGRAHLPAYADDHAAFILACLDLYESTFDPDWLEAANTLADTLVDLFASEEGPLHYVGRDAEPLITRSHNPIGGAEPGANGLAALAFVRLEHLSMRTDLGDRAEAILSAYQPLLQRSPLALGLEALAAHWKLTGGLEIGIVGGREACTPLLDVLRPRYLPFSVLAVTEDPVVHPRLPWMHGRGTDNGVPTAWVCEGYACRLPTTSPEELATQLDAAITPSAAPHATEQVRVRAPELPSDPDLWLHNDAPLPLASLQGHVVLLDFWTYCCINCMHVLPELAAVEEAFEGQPVVVIGVHAAKFPAEKEAENVLRAVHRHRIRHPVVLDPAHTLWSAYAVRAWPTLAVVDATGRIAWQKSGEASREELIPLVQRLLDEARDAGILAEKPRWRRPAWTSPSGPLAFPGKVTVWPDAMQQEQGADAFGPDARLYVADTGHDRILECALSAGADGWPVARVLRVFGGSPGMQDGADARFRMPQGMARLGDVLYVADTENHELRAIHLADGTVRTLAGTGRRGAGGPIHADRPLEIDLRSPWDVVATGTPDKPVLLVAMAGTHQIWVYLSDPQPQFGPFAGSGREDHVDGALDEAALAQPSGLLLYGRYLFFADSEVSSIRAVDLQERTVGTVVGRGLFDFGDVDGPAEDVLLQHPLGLTAIGSTLYVADTFNHKIKAIAIENGHTCTIVGGADALGEPGGVARAGDFLIVADTNHHRLRVVHPPTGTIRDLPVQGLTTSASGT